MGSDEEDREEAEAAAAPKYRTIIGPFFPRDRSSFSDNEATTLESMGDTCRDGGPDSEGEDDD